MDDLLLLLCTVPEFQLVEVNTKILVAATIMTSLNALSHVVSVSCVATVGVDTRAGSSDTASVDSSTCLIAWSNNYTFILFV